MLSRNDFAKAVVHRLGQLRAPVLPRYDELSFGFFIDESAAADTNKTGHLRLEPWYERYLEALLDNRGQQAVDDVAHYWMQLLQNAQAQCALDASRMVPLLRSRFDFAVTALRSQGADGAGLDQLAWRVLADHLVVALAEESPQSWRLVTTRQLSHAGLTWDAALAQAMKNLPRVEPSFVSASPFAVSEGQTFVPNARQSPHSAAWLLWPDRLRTLPVAGQLVAFAPFAHTLAITGSENHADLARLAAATLSLARTLHDKPLTAIPLVLDGRQWQPWLPPAAHPLHAAIKELWCLHASSIYGEQGKLLKQQLEGRDDAPYVASYKALAATAASGQRMIHSLAAWTETLPTLLPKTDAVALTKVLNRAELDAGQASEPQLGETITVDWQDLAAYLGERLKPQGMYPERFRVEASDFPAGADWERLAQSASPAGAAAAELPSLGAAARSPAPAPAGLLGPIGPAAPVAPVQAAAAPLAPAPWQSPQPASKIPVAPARRKPVWPIVLAVTVPIGGVLVLILGLSIFLFLRFSAARSAMGQRITMTRQASFDRPPPYEIKAPWTRVEAFPELKSPEQSLPRLEYGKQDVVLSGRGRSGYLGDFRDEAPAGGWLVGVRVVRGSSWGGAVRSVRPIYQVEDEYHLGGLCGEDDGFAQTEVLARPGYAVGKIECRIGLVMNALRLTFYRVDGERLDPADSYSTPWLGSEGGGTTPAIGGRGEPIVGIVGGGREDIEHFQGLLATPLPKPQAALPESTGTAVSGEATDQRSNRSFPDRGPAGSWLVGLRVFQGESWGGAPLAIQPIYQLGEKYVLGSRLGEEGGELHQWIAPPGYAVGEIWADQGLVVHRLQLRYQRVVDGTLDTADVQDSPRLGPDGGQKHRLTSAGRPIVGLNLGLGSDIESLELVVAQ